MQCVVGPLESHLGIAIRDVHPGTEAKLDRDALRRLDKQGRHVIHDEAHRDVGAIRDLARDLHRGVRGKDGAQERRHLIAYGDLQGAPERKHDRGDVVLGQDLIRVDAQREGAPVRGNIADDAQALLARERLFVVGSQRRLAAP